MRSPMPQPLLKRIANSSLFALLLSCSPVPKLRERERASCHRWSVGQRLSWQGLTLIGVVMLVQFIAVRGWAIELTSPALIRLKPTDEVIFNDEIEKIEIPLRLEISLSKRRLSVFQGEELLHRYPVAVGRSGWETPVGKFKVLQKIHKPDWKNPFNGDIIPGGDPENPLGHYWIGFWSDGKNAIGLHGTPNPKSVGRAASHGCVRMYNKDIEELFPQVKSGTPVIVTR